VGTPSVVAEGLEPCEDFIGGHGDDYTRNSKKSTTNSLMKILPRYQELAAIEPGSDGMVRMP
jgi:hypothetical protein